MEPGSIRMYISKVEGSSGMNQDLVTKLLESFDELDRCIVVTKQVLSAREGVPTDVLARVDQYADIVVKQRSLAGGLRKYIECENWDEVARHVKLINGLSAMIRDDAQAILSGSYQKTTDSKESVLLS